jgi:hypothetical protein
LVPQRQVLEGQLTAGAEEGEAGEDQGTEDVERSRRP